MAKKKKPLKISNNLLYPPSLFGHRYVFFIDALEEDAKEDERYRQLLTNVKTHFGHLKMDLSLDITDTEHYMALENILSELDQISDKMRQKEIAYAAQAINKIQSSDEIIPQKMQDELYNILQAIQSEKSISQEKYLQLIRLLSELKTDHKLLERSIEEQKKNIALLQSESDKQLTDMEKQMELKENYIWEYSKAQKTIKTLDLTSFVYDTINEQIASMFNEVMDELTTSTKFKEVVENANILNEKAFEDKIIQIIATSLQQKFKDFEHGSTNTKTKLYNKIKTKIIKLLTEQELDTTGATNVLIRPLVSLEEQAIEKGTELAEIFMTYTESVQRSILYKYINENKVKKLEKNWNAWMNRLKNSTTKNNNTRRALTIALREGIRKAYQETEQTIRKRWEEAGKEIDENKLHSVILQTIKVPIGGFSKFLSVTRATHDKIAEILAAPIVHGQINKILSNSLLGAYYPGVNDPLKVDVQYLVRFSCTADDLMTSDLNAKFNSFFNKQLSNFYKNFHRTYNIEKIGTSVTVAMKAYINEMRHTQKEIIEYAQKNNIDINQLPILDQIKNMFSEEISVKDYIFYDDKLGFHMGNLGGGQRVATVVNNIINIYHLLGIPLPENDTELIIEAILNASEEGTTYFHPEDDTITQIKYFLIGGAAMMGFDAGFTYTKKFIEKLKKLYFSQDVNHIQLYRLNTLIIPASYVLKNICENVRQILNLLPQDYKRVTSEKVHSDLYIYNHMKYENFTNSADFMATNAVQRWNTVSETANKEVKITMLFMAGILDIFENLPALITKI